jgi:hypothetical protein
MARLAELWRSDGKSSSSFITSVSGMDSLDVVKELPVKRVTSDVHRLGSELCKCQASTRTCRTSGLASPFSMQ